MNREAWQATVHGIERVGHDLVTKNHHQNQLYSNKNNTPLKKKKLKKQRKKPNVRLSPLGHTWFLFLTECPLCQWQLVLSMALTNSWVYQTVIWDKVITLFRLPLWKGQEFCLTRIHALYANRLAFVYTVSVYRTINALSTTTLPNQTWVCSSGHSKANLLKPGYGEERCSTYCKAKQRVWATDVEKALVLGKGF